MSKYNYIDHISISLAEFELLEEKLKRIEERITPIMFQKGFSISPKKQVVLGIGYCIDQSVEGRMGGAIDLLFDDIVGKTSFTLSVVKAYDRDNIRHWASSTICKNIELHDIESNVMELFSKAVDTYNAWEEKDLTKTLKLLETRMMTKQDMEEALKNANITSNTAQDLEEVLKNQKKKLDSRDNKE